jgi:hypothetical protein
MLWGIAADPTFPVMVECAFCGAETQLYQNGVPVCVKCSEDFERVVKKLSERKPEPPPDPATHN